MSSEGELLGKLVSDAVPNGLGIGDDAACLPDGTLLTVDALVEGVHFNKDTDPADIAYKLLAVNLSDIAAMGGEPTWAVLTLAVSNTFAAEHFLKALQSHCHRYGVSLVGGDTVSSPTTVVSLTLLGMSGKVIARRDAVRSGDVVVVTGPLGGAVRSGRHLAPVPRLEEGRWLVGMGVRAMMDLSDGLAAGLHTLAQASHVQLRCTGSDIPLHDDTYGADVDERIAAAFNDGEDFELLATVPPRLWTTLVQGIYPLVAIGEVVEGEGVQWRPAEGDDWRSLESKGFEHTW